MLHYNQLKGKPIRQLDKFFHNSPGIRITGALLIYGDQFKIITAERMTTSQPPSIFFIASLSDIIFPSSFEMIEAHSFNSLEK